MRVRTGVTKVLSVQQEMQFAAPVGTGALGELQALAAEGAQRTRKFRFRDL